MPTFFESIDDIHQFTLSLRWHQHQLSCPHCHKHDQWVSHGFCYRQTSITQTIATGKRIVCSDRFGRLGCGRTQRLYCADQVPALHYSLSVLATFIIAILDTGPSRSIADCYGSTTGACSARQAWRWLKKLQHQLGAFRSFLLLFSQRDLLSCSSPAKPLLASLMQLHDRLGSPFALRFQLMTQRAFV